MRECRCVLAIGLAAFLLSDAWAKTAANVCAVVPGRQYELSFRARVAAGPTLEDRPEYAELVGIVVSRPTVSGVRFAAANWTFLDANGKKVARPYEGSQPITLFSRAWRTVVEHVWIPDGAVSIRVGPLPGDSANRVELSDVMVRELPRNGTLFSTRSFDDPYCPSDWRLVGAAQYLTDAEGRGVIATEAGHANGLPFPVVPGSRLRVRLNGQTSSRVAGTDLKCWIGFARGYADTMKAGGFKRAGRSVTLSGRQKSAVQEYVVPDGMTWARLTVRDGLLSGVEVKVVQ